MEPKPVSQSRQPAYPTRREVLAGLASVGLVPLARCFFVLAADAEGKIKVAPIFEHGEGRGATGCVVVSPPVFLSEEEGMQILREELAKHGIKLKPGGELQGVRVPTRTRKYEEVDKGNGQKETKVSIVDDPEHAKPLKLDGIDSGRKIAVEFVSQKSNLDRGGVYSFSTVQRYDFKEVAQNLVALVKKDGRTALLVGVFYDPLMRTPRSLPSENGKKVDRETAWKQREKLGKKESEKLLRQQAQDFVAWLKKEKAIP